MTVLDAITLVLVSLAAATGGLRWLRVAQREHYLAGEVSRAAWSWWSGSAENMALGVLGIGAAAVSAVFAPVALVAGAVAAVAPLRLTLRGRTSRLVWTRRLATLAAASTLAAAVAIGAGAVGAGIDGAVLAAALTAMLSPALVDLGLALTHPLEEALAGRFVKRARHQLERVRPLVVAVTGSYGKTTTKGYIAHLVGGQRATLASPKSFNNRAGLARTVNEHLGPGTEVFVAEMGTYGPGEIAAMCSWLQPEISVITAIGPAHLQRFRSLDRTLAAKAEIAATARVVVLNSDDARLLGLAGVLRGTGKKVVGASGTNEVADVAVLVLEDGLELRLDGRRVGVASVSAADIPTATSNAACAAAVALELGVSPEEVLARLASLPVPPNRLQRYLADGGYVVLDDTFNSNPSGARIALSKLKSDPGRSPDGRLVVVTPGMIELGPTQRAENADLGEAAARVAAHLVVVARTNRAALLEGASRAGDGAAVVAVDRLDQALEWVKSTLGPGDVVLYENDLPDHFP
jgi:UDP-N-acetylmuramoyl-tripeptide--D-alanyl-D-alanine ligase